MIRQALARLGKARPGGDLVSLRAVLRPLSGILVITVGMCVALFWALVAQMDQHGARNAQLMMRGAIETRLGALAEMTRDYGRWDDAVLHLYGQLDRKWAVDNLSNATHVLIIDQQGRTLFSTGPDGSAGVDGRAAMPDGIPQLLKRLPTSLEGARAMDDSVGLVTTFEGEPMLVAAMPIVPYSDRIAAPREPLRFVLITQALDEALLNDWQRSFRLKRVSVVDRLQGHDPTAAEPIRNVDGAIIAWLTWSPVRPGREAAAAILPYLLVGFVLLGLACLFLSTRVVAIVRALSREQDATRRSAEVAAANLEMARQAQVRAEAAQLRAENSALQAEAARREAALHRQGASWSGPLKHGPRVA